MEPTTRTTDVASTPLSVLLHSIETLSPADRDALLSMLGTKGTPSSQALRISAIENKAHSTADRLGDLAARTANLESQQWAIRSHNSNTSNRLEGFASRISDLEARSEYRGPTVGNVFWGALGIILLGSLIRAAIAPVGVVA